MEFAQIAGPSQLLNNFSPQLNQGVIVARINDEIAQLEFERSLRQLARDVATVYWDLYFATKQYEDEKDAADSLERSWNAAQAQIEEGLTDAATEAQTAEQYFAARTRAQQAQSQMLITETRLRRLLGLPASDGTIITPIDTPKRPHR